METAQDTLAISSKTIKSAGGDQVYPEVRLCGRWLENLGFKAGDRCKVEIVGSRVTISPTEDEKPARPRAGKAAR